MNYNTLKNELDNDPLGRGYLAMTDEQAAYDLSEVDYRTVNYPVQLDGLNMAIRESGKWTSFSEKAQLQTTPDVYTNQSMYEFMSLFPSLTGANTMNLQGPYLTALLDACVAEGSMGPAVAAAIKAFGEKIVSRGVELNLGVVSETDVAYARSL